MNPSNGTVGASDHTPEQERRPVDVAAAQAKAEGIVQIVRNTIAEGHPPEPDSPLWRFVNRAA